MTGARCPDMITYSNKEFRSRTETEQRELSRVFHQTPDMFVYNYWPNATSAKPLYKKTPNRTDFNNPWLDLTNCPCDGNGSSNFAFRSSVLQRILSLASLLASISDSRNKLQSFLIMSIYFCLGQPLARVPWT